MLSLALRFGNDATDLEQALPGLIGLATEKCPLLFIDHGSQDASRERIQAFIRRHGGTLVALEGQTSAAEATAVARQQTGAGYVLCVTPQDRINRAGLAVLERRLDEVSPELVMLPGAFWATSAAHPIPGPDAARATHAPRRLFADPRRLLLRGGACDHPDPLADPAAAWAIWDATLGADRDVLHVPGPVLLRPLPEAGAAPAFAAAADWLMAAPKAARAGRLSDVLLRLDDALALAPAAAAPETLAAATRFQAALPRALRRGLRDRPGPAADLLRALARKDQAGALAQLGLLAQVRADLCVRALAAEYAALRHDLDLALPGPGYLMELYTRLRGV